MEGSKKKGGRELREDRRDGSSWDTNTEAIKRRGYNDVANYG